MDQHTLALFRDLCVKEPKETANNSRLNNLTSEENSVYLFLQKTLLRLEQERIRFHYLQLCLLKL